MLFDRFIFVIYLLFTYSWFLLGMHYDTEIRFVSLVSMICSLSCVVVISMCQIQKLFMSNRSSSADRWSTILWSMVHLVLSSLMLLDGLEYINPMVVFALSGVVLSIVVITVGTCSYHVIMRNSHSWTPHIHLTCISFWAVMQYVSLRFPQAPMTWMTTPPVICMAIVRIFEWYEDRILNKKEAVVWFACCLIHILYDTGVIPQTLLYWGMASTVSAMCILMGHQVDLLLFITVPILVLPLAIYVCVEFLTGFKCVENLSDIIKMYEDMVQEPTIEHIPLELPEEQYWEERL